MAAPRLTAQAAIIGIGRLINMAAAAGTLMALARVLPDRESYGAICQLIMLYMVLSQIFAVGLPQSTYYFLPRYFGGERRGFLIQTVVLLMVSGLVLGSGLYLGAGPLGHLLNSKLLTPLLRVFAIYPLLMLPTLAVEGTLLHARRPATTVAFNALVRLGMFCSLVIPALCHAPLLVSVEVWMGVAVGMWLIALVLMFSTVRGLPFIWQPRMLRDEWTFSVPLAMGTLLAVGGAYFDRFLVSHLFGAEQFGIYANATVEIPTVSVVANATSVVLTSEFSRRISAGENSAVLRIWHQAMLKTSILSFASLGFLAFWGYETMQLLFSSRFTASGGIFTIYVWVIPVLIFSWPSLFISMGATRPFIAVVTTTFIADIICISVLGALFGIRGIAFGAILGRLLGVIFGLHWYACWLTRVGWKGILPWRSLLFTLGIALAAGSLSRIAHFLPQQTSPAIITYLIGLLLFLLFYLVGLNLTNLLPYVLPAKWQETLSRRDEEVQV